MPGGLKANAGPMRKVALLGSFLLLAASCYAQGLIWHSPAPSESQSRELLQGICPQGIHKGDGSSGPVWGCEPCPSFTTNGDSPLASRGLFALDAVFYGSFSAPGMNEAVASFGGCEPHASGYGGTILLRRFTEGWNMVRYRQALITDSCQKYPLKSGRDLLLCENEDHHMNGGGQSIFTCDFSADQESQGGDVFGVADTRAACGHSAVWSSIDRAELHDINGDGIPDLSIWISIAQGTFPGAGGVCAVDTSQVPAQTYRLDFLFQPQTNRFLPAPQSAPMVDHFAALFKTAQEEADRTVRINSAP